MDKAFDGATRMKAQVYLAIANYLQREFESQYVAEKEAMPKEDKRGAWTHLSAAGLMFAKAITPKEKCRIIVEYDPADEKVAIYKTELDGKVKTYKELFKAFAEGDASGQGE